MCRAMGDEADKGQVSYSRFPWIIYDPLAHPRVKHTPDLVLLNNRHIFLGFLQCIPQSIRVRRQTSSRRSSSSNFYDPKM
jgi:hypothetical protein